MNFDTAWNLHLRVTRAVYGVNPFDYEFIVDLRNLSIALSCYVCYQLLNDPYSSSESSCQHNVCKQCLGKPLRLPVGGRKTCADCKDITKFQASIPMQKLVSVFAQICYHLRRFDHRLLEMRLPTDEYNKILNIICAAANLIDDNDNDVTYQQTLPLNSAKGVSSDYSIEYGPCFYRPTYCHEENELNRQLPQKSIVKQELAAQNANIETVLVKPRRINRERRSSNTVLFSEDDKIVKRRRALRPR